MDYVALISNVGFPIAVTLYFMFSTEKVISENTKAIYELKEEIMRWKK